MISRSMLAKNPRYAEIISVYREQFVAQGGKVNEKKFWEQHIHPIVPNYGLKAWYQFIDKFRKSAGMAASLAVEAASAGPVTQEEGKLEAALMSNETATQLGIRSALNIGAKALESLLKDPMSLAAMTPTARAELLFKAMKAQDSRIHAIGKLKEDGREQAKFDKTFGGAAY